MAIGTKMKHGNTPRIAAVSARRVVVKRDRRHLPGMDSKPRFARKTPPHTGHTFAKAIRFLSSLNDFERLRIVRYNSQNFDLDRMRTLLRRLGNPQDKFKSVHIAGTKGKGSTCAMIASMLQACGYKFGLYHSPTLTYVRQRI